MAKRQRMFLATAIVVMSAGMAASIGQPAAAQTKYQSAEEAYNVAAAFFNSRNYKAALEPLEAAVSMAPDDKFKIKAYRALIVVYREQPGVEKMMEACEFVMDHSDQAAERSLTARSYLSFMFNRGEIDKLIARQEERLKKDEKDKTSLFLLGEAYSKVKNDPKKAAEYVERLAKLQEESGKPLDVATNAQLAQQYVQAGKSKEGAELFEKIAPLDETLAAWHWKEAANAWLKAGDKAKAAAAAKKSAESAPEKRSQLLTHFWHRALGEVFLETGDAKTAIPHLEQAIENTTIEGYKKDCEKKLAEARAKAPK